MPIKEFDIELNLRRLSNNARLRGKRYPNKVIVILVLHKGGRVYKIYQISGDKIPPQRQISWRRLVEAN